MLVREHRNRPVWRYASVGNIEVLSQCDDRTTSSFVTAYDRRQLELERLLPPGLQLAQSTPLTIILVTPAVQKTMREELVKTMNQSSGKETSGYVTPQASAWQVYRLVRTIPQLTLYDADSTGLVCTLDPAHGSVEMQGEASGFFKGLANDGTYSDMSFTMGHMGVLLGGRVPPLPSWFRSAFLALYREINWTTQSNTISANPVLWISGAQARQIRNDPLRPEESDRILLPFPKFFAGQAGSTPPLTMAESDLWSAQASLFLHWAYADPRRRDALWKFVDQSSRAAPTEALFQACFGLSFHRAGEELIAYLPKAARSPLPLLEVNAIRVPEFQLRNATYIEAARLKGDMGRKEITYVKQLDPDSAEQYVAEVGAVLNGPLEDGENDPAEAAVLGLYDCDLGKDDEALPFLEQAAAAHIARPTVYVQLAKIRLEKASGPANASGGKLGPEQVAELTGLLREGQRYAPAQADSYLTAADIWTRAEVSPSHENLAMLAEGVELFPDNFEVVAAGAKLYAANGFQSEGLGLIDHALGYAGPNSSLRSRLTDLRSQVVTSPSP